MATWPQLPLDLLWQEIIQYIVNIRRNLIPWFPVRLVPKVCLTLPDLRPWSMAANYRIQGRARPTYVNVRGVCRTRQIRLVAYVIQWHVFIVFCSLADQCIWICIDRTQQVVKSTHGIIYFWCAKMVISLLTLSEVNRIMNLSVQIIML